MKKLLSTFLIAVAFMACGICMTACNELPKHTITFIDGDTTYSTIETAGLKSITLPTEPTKENYTFAGWYFDNNTWQNQLTNDYYKDKALESDVSVYAKWDIPTSYYIDYILNGGTNNVNNPSTYTIKTETITLLAPSKIGYTFAGWFDNSRFSGNAITEIAKGSSGNKTLYAKWTINTYTITYNLNGGTNNVNNPENYTVEDNITLLTPSKIGYTFAGWFNNSTFSGSAVTAIPQGSTGDITLYTKWTLNTYTISYILNDGTNNIGNPDTYTVETETITLLTPTKTGYTFSGWYNNSTFSGDAITSIPQGSANNITLYAKWTVDNYSITYNLNGGTNNADNSATFNIESGDITLKAPSRNGYTFDGWFDNENFSGDAVTKIAQGTLKNITLYAKWKIVTYSIDYIVFLGKNNDNNPATYTVETATITLLAPTKDGYTFDGWFDNLGFSGDAITEIAKGSFGNKTFYAKWVPIDYTITYELDDGTNNESNPSTYNIETNFTLLAPTKAMYEFMGWFIGDEKITTLSSGYFKDLTITAHWQSIFVMDQVETTKLIGITPYGKTLTEIVVPEGVETIGDSVMSGLTKLTTITFPSTLKTIDNEAFSGCINLANFEFPNGIETIGEKAFWACENIDTITFPSTLKAIGKEAFEGCTELANIEFANGIETIGEKAFFDCEKIVTIALPSSVTSIGKDVFAGCKALTTLTLPFVGAERKIATDSFQYPLGYLFGTESYENSYKVTQTYISETIISIDATNYYIPSSLTTLTILDGSILPGALMNCSSLTSITLPNNILNIGALALKGCTGITEITIPKSVLNIGVSAFASCTNLNTVTFEQNSITSLIEASAFDSCANLENFVFPSSMLKVGNNAFNGCTKLMITEGAYTYIKSASNNYFALIKVDSNITTASVESGCQVIADSAFSGCENLANVELPNTVKSIGMESFKGCTKLNQITFSNSLLNIDESAFQDCSSLQQISLPTSLLAIGNSAFSGSGLTTITLPTNVKTIGNEVFAYCNSLTKVEIPSGVESIGANLFFKCSYIEEITMPFVCTALSLSGSTSYFPFGAFFTDAFNAQSVYYNSYLVRQNYEHIDKNGKVSIYTGQYYVPNSLKTLTINGGKLVYGAFMDMTSLTAVNLLDSITEIPNCAFKDCTNLSSITITSSVTSIGTDAFKGCTALSTVIIDSEAVASGLTSQDAQGYLINSATTIKIREDITTIGTYVTNTENFTYTSTIDGYKVYTKVS